MKNQKQTSSPSSGEMPKADGACIIAIGDELLWGQTVDTNSAWIGKKLAENGIKVKEKYTIGDNPQALKNKLDEAKAKANIILITGGLGPTKDDLTKNTLAEYFNSKLIFNQNTLNDIQKFFKERNKELNRLNRSQAEVPDKCIPLRNTEGTAPGMWFEEKGKIFVSMPGVPFEMEKMIENEVLPRLKKQFQTPAIIHKHIHTIGIREAHLAEKLENFEENLPQYIKMAYLPGLSTVKLRLTTSGEDEKQIQEEINEQVKKLQSIIGKYIYGYDDDSMEAIAGQLLKNKNATISTAESCTGGFIAHRLTSVPGSSAYFEGAVISYSNAIKINVLGVKKETLERHGAVSEEVVIEMAKGVKEKLQTDYSIAVSGIAGPGGGTEEKPVGTVWIAVATPDKIVTKKFHFQRNRQHNIELTTVFALNMLREELI